MKAIVCAVQPSKEGCSKDHALKQPPPGKQPGYVCFPQAGLCTCGFNGKKINGDNSPSTQPAVLMGNKSGSKCHCTKGAV